MVLELEWEAKPEMKKKSIPARQLSGSSQNNLEHLGTPNDDALQNEATDF